MAAGAGLRDSVALWEHTRKVTPDTFFTRTHLGLAYQEEGRLEEAELEFAAALDLRPDLALSYDNLGVLNLRQGKPESAEARFRDARTRDPHASQYRIHLVEALKAQKRTAEAELELQAIRELSSDKPARSAAPGSS